MPNSNESIRTYQTPDIGKTVGENLAGLNTHPNIGLQVRPAVSQQLFVMGPAGGINSVVQPIRQCLLTKPMVQALCGAPQGTIGLRAQWAVYGFWSQRTFTFH